MRALGHPERSFKAVHITGTNGKGSVASMLAQVLHESGYKVGLYTSPYVRRFNERIRVNGQEIVDQQLEDLFQKIKSAQEQLNLPLTFFEFITALAFIYFAEQKVEIAVVEVGIGGALDATNVIPAPEVAVITNIGLDHTEILGATKESILKDKAGIIKRGSDVVTREQDDRLLKVLERMCQAHQASLTVVQHVIKPERLTLSLSGQVFKTSGLVNDVFEISLLGAHQIKNACTALVVLTKLTARGWNISEEAIKKGLAKAHWPGRLQVISQHPLIIVDGAHNEDGFLALADFLKQDLPNIVTLDQPYDTLIVGVKNNKKLGSSSQELVSLFKQVIVTESNYEAMPAGRLSEQLLQLRLGMSIIKESEVELALLMAKKRTPSAGIIVITGSLYLVGDILNSFQVEKN